VDRPPKNHVEHRVGVQSSELVLSRPSLLQIRNSEIYEHPKNHVHHREGRELSFLPSPPPPWRPWGKKPCPSRGREGGKLFAKPPPPPDDLCVRNMFMATNPYLYFGRFICQQEPSRAVLWNRNRRNRNFWPCEPEP